MASAQRERILQWLADQVPPARLQHILGVEQTAIALAERYDASPSQAQLAALLHDAAKYFSPARLLSIARREALTIDPICAAHPHLLHADVGAIVARDEFAIGDRDVLSAIANHTLGQPDMNTLGCIVFVADAIEPGRGDTPELEALRQDCWADLRRGVYRTCDYSLQHLIATGRPIHPRTVATRNWALSRSPVPTTAAHHLEEEC